MKAVLSVFHLFRNINLQRKPGSNLELYAERKNKSEEDTGKKTTGIKYAEYTDKTFLINKSS